MAKKPCVCSSHYGNLGSEQTSRPPLSLGDAKVRRSIFSAALTQILAKATRHARSSSLDEVLFEDPGGASWSITSPERASWMVREKPARVSGLLWHSV